MKMLTLGLLGLLAFTGSLTGTAQAQERAAGGAREMQMTWDALRTLVANASSSSTAVNKRVDKVVVCGKKGMVYADNATGVDTDGCLSTGSSGSLIQIGEVVNPNSSGSANTFNVAVVFPKPYKTVPQLTTATNDYYYSGGCSTKAFNTGASVTNLTATGFNVSAWGRTDGCNSNILKKVMWMAIGQ